MLTNTLSPSSESPFIGLNNDSSESPSMPSQFSALWIFIRSLTSCSSVLPPISPPRPLMGPNTSWLYNGSFTTGYPVFVCMVVFVRVGAKVYLLFEKRCWEKKTQSIRFKKTVNAKVESGAGRGEEKEKKMEKFISNIEHRIYIERISNVIYKIYMCKLLGIYYIL